MLWAVPGLCFGIEYEYELAAWFGQRLPWTSLRFGSSWGWWRAEHPTNRDESCITDEDYSLSVVA